MLSCLQILLLLGIVGLVRAVLPLTATPEYIHSCSRKDPQANECIRKAFEHLKPYLKKGIQELKVQPFEPLRIPKVLIENNNGGGLRLRALFSNITVHGVSNYSITEVRCNLTTYKIDLTIAIPRLEATGNYDVNGQILLAPVRGRGDFWALFSDIVGVGRVSGKEIMREGVKVMMVDRMQADYKIGKARFKIRDHVNKNSVLSEAMNQFLNQNALEVVEEMKPAAKATFIKKFKTFINNAFTQVPIQLWLKD